MCLIFEKILNVHSWVADQLMIVPFYAAFFARSYLKIILWLPCTSMPKKGNYRGVETPISWLSEGGKLESALNFIILLQVACFFCAALGLFYGFMLDAPRKGKFVSNKIFRWSNSLKHFKSTTSGQERPPCLHGFFCRAGVWPKRPQRMENSVINSQTIIDSDGEINQVLFINWVIREGHKKRGEDDRWRVCTGQKMSQRISRRDSWKGHRVPEKKLRIL